MFRSLQWRLTFYFLFVLLLTNLVISIFFYFRWKSNWKRGAHERLLGAAQLHARLIASNFPKDLDPAKVTAFLRRGRRFPVDVVFFDSNGRVLAHNSQEEKPPLRTGVRDRLPEVLSGRVEDVYWESRNLSESHQHLLVPWRFPPKAKLPKAPKFQQKFLPPWQEEEESLRHRGSPFATMSGFHRDPLISREGSSPPFGAIYVRESFPSYRLRWQFWREIVVAGVLISTLFGFLLSRSLARPVHTMAAVAEAIAAGDLSQRIAYRSPDELGQLADKFNVMAARMQELVDTLSEERDHLQEVLEQLRESERRRDELVANVSHELRTPLACIQGCVEALVDGVAATPDRQQQCLRTIADETHYLSRLVNDLLNLARASLGQLEMEVQPVDLREVARQAVAKFQPQAERQRVALEFTEPPELPPVQADPGRIVQVLTNLLDNALRHTPAGGRVQLNLQEQEEGAFVTVEDTGSGIPKEELPAVFERFYRADQSRNRETGGSGLGLAIVREIVRAHGGNVWIESELGQGTKVGFQLPWSSSQ